MSDLRQFYDADGTFNQEAARRACLDILQQSGDAEGTATANIK